jgi:putative ribosome biogenesis GTPase RsgA
LFSAIEKLKITKIIGESGLGKTTLINSLFLTELDNEPTSVNFIGTFFKANYEYYLD